jgi:hypothetical protein
VQVLPGVVTSGVFVSMDKALDQALSMNVSPPLPGPKGPDRLLADVAVWLGPDGYAILPAGQQSPFLPVQGAVTLVGLPGLDAELTGALYVASGRAVTGASATAPMSVISAVQTNNTSKPIDMSGFVGVPVLTTPTGDVAWDGMHLATTFPAGSAPPDLTVYDIASGNGLVHWTIAAAGGSQSVTVPSLAAFPAGALPPGPITIAVRGGRVPSFNYGKLTYRQMTSTGMSAYALDYFDAHL